MNELDKCYNIPFSHVYIEKQAGKYPITQKVLSKLKNSQIIEINNYMDIFARPHQDFAMQKKSPALILAVKKKNLVYPGAKVCQSFGNSNFYYTSIMMNCLFDCEYCYLQGMYPSGNIVLFVNQQDYFDEIEKLLYKAPVYLCISYDSDLLAVENLTEIVSAWKDFCRSHKNLTIEVRTKSGNISFFENNQFPSNMIFAWTLSPQEITKKYEHGTGSFRNRLMSAKAAQDNGAVVRICFDPMIYVKDYKQIYKKAIDTTFEILDSSKILDCSVGVFRISSEYIKKMRQQRSCAVTEYPYITQQGVCSYGDKKNKEMMDFAKNEIGNKIGYNKIFEFEQE